MDVLSIGSISCRLPILDGEYYREWRDKMLAIFNEFHLSKYVKNPYMSPIDPLHPSHEEEIDMLRNLRTINLIVRALISIAFVLSPLEEDGCV